MKRKDFLTTLGLSSASIILPSNGFINEQSINIYDNYLSGVQFYDFDEITKKIKEGDELRLLREADNKYDSFAVSIYFDKYKIGYIPAYENIVIANMLDKEISLKVFVSKLEKENYQGYRSIAVQIFAPLIVPTQKLVDLIETSKRADDHNDEYRRRSF